MARDLLNGFRTFTFWTASFIILLAIWVCDMMDWSDPAIVSYALTFSISIICGSMFADWWRIKGNASSVYKWITALLFAIAFNDLAQLIARIYFVYIHQDYEWAIKTVWWQYRSMPKLVALIYLLTFAVWQRWGSASTYHDGIRQDMADGFKSLDARIIAGEVRFEGHSHDGLVLGAKLIIKPLEEPTK
jgi:hypothetical protein